jgi:hypothetical protein
MGHGAPDEIAGVEAVEGAEQHLAGVGPMGGRCLSARGERRVGRAHADVRRSVHASTGCGLSAVGCALQAARQAHSGAPRGRGRALAALAALAALDALSAAVATVSLARGHEASGTEHWSIYEAAPYR